MSYESHAFLGVSVEDKVGVVELRRPPHNYFDLELIATIADTWEAFERDPGVRAIVLCAEGKSFCAGADFSKSENVHKKRSTRQTNPLYQEAVRLFACTKPVVAAIEGSAVGGGLGVALTADFRVSCEEARFSANFNRLGFHPGFGLSHTLPALIGPQKAAWMFYTGARIDGRKALDIGLIDELVDKNQVRATAMTLAREIATSSPRAVQATRETLRRGLLDAIRLAVVRESSVQAVQMTSEDMKEGVAAMAERRPPDFAD
ncbi:Crotonyl-CoA hydratase [bioreactor metagenome]|uniref:Crotonyl-CoA hydratase n=1 Tax=bioreactor metagenome TaxID=1076179 RepID=A0A644WTJ9_9ZZZZ